MQSVYRTTLAVNIPTRTFNLEYGTHQPLFHCDENQLACTKTHNIKILEQPKLGYYRVRIIMVSS